MLEFSPGALDAHITGNWGEDAIQAEEDEKAFLDTIHAEATCECNVDYACPDCVCAFLEEAFLGFPWGEQE